jgi:hypothetical protein
VSSSTRLHRSAAPLPPTERRSFVLGVSNGARSRSPSRSSPPIRADEFRQLTASNFLIGLVVQLRDAGWFLPQLFVLRIPVPRAR